MSGGQAKNAVMMQLFADTCGIPIVLPKSHSEAVVLGAAMLGRIAAQGVKEGEDMWKIMVRNGAFRYIQMLTYRNLG
jgi:ribulose kinase